MAASWSVYSLGAQLILFVLSCTRSLKCILLVPIFALDSAVDELQEMFSSHGGHLTNAMYHHGETL